MTNMLFSNRNERMMRSGDDDQRYRMTIMLITEKRPSYWKFHCPKCTTFIAELSGTMMSVTDAADETAIPDYQPAPMIVQCKGKFCRIYYEFVTLSGK